jgi:peptide/nickel transport system ATP-binding protein
MSGTPLLDVADLRVDIRTDDGVRRVVNDVSFTLNANEVLCVVGESGSGKSVTMLSIMRLMDERSTAYGGRVTFAHTDLLSVPVKEMQRVRGAEIAMIFQDPMTALNPVYPIGWQIAEQIGAHTDTTGQEVRAQALQLLKTVGISDPERRIDAYPHQLSGGMRQRVMIALALSCRPRILIADEPTTALDVTIQAQILALIAELKDETGMSIILVTHDMGVVAELADRVQVMYGGRIVEEGSTAEIFDDPQHPYTWGLLASIPRLDLPKPRRLPSIPGSPANAGDEGAACVFVARCPFRFDACADQPPLVSVGPTRHRAACHLSVDERSRARPVATSEEVAP